MGLKSCWSAASSKTKHPRGRLFPSLLGRSLGGGGTIKNQGSIKVPFKHKTQRAQRAHQRMKDSHPPLQSGVRVGAAGALQACFPLFRIGRLDGKTNTAIPA